MFDGIETEYRLSIGRYSILFDTNEYRLLLDTRCQYRPNPTLEGPAIGAGNHRMGFTPQQVRSRRVWKSLYLCKFDHAKCRGVYIFNSEYCGNKIEIESTSHSL